MTDGRQPASDLDRFREMAVCDEAVRLQLLAEPDRARFCVLVSVLASERGLTVPAGDVEAALVAARRAWLERWV